METRVFLFCFVILLHVLVQRTVAMTGGWSDADPENEDIKRIAKIGVELFQLKSDSEFTSQLIRIVKAQQQVVAGLNYNLDVDVGFTDCKKDEQREPSSCNIREKQSCILHIWEQPWLDRVELTEFKCDPAEHMTSDEKSLNKDVEDATDFAVSYLQSMSDGLYTIQLKRILQSNIQTQTVVLRKMKLECLMSSCVAPETDCDETRKETITCDVEVSDQKSNDPRFAVKRYRCSGVQFDASGKKSMNSVNENTEAFEDFKKQYKKQYENMDEETWRFNVFEENMKIIKFLEDHELGTAKYGVTQFADLTPEEFRKHYLTPYWDQSEDKRLQQADIPSMTLPPEYDWRHYNVVTEVKNQGACGSCWAFSVTGNIEGQWAIQKKNLVSLSEQELVDCDKLDLGCNGGLPSNAYQEIQRLGGLESETDYPYKGRDDSCHLVKGDVHVYINGSLNISKDETEMAAWLYKNGPMSIGINAFAMQFYFGGVSHPWKLFCSPDDLDHGVLIVGYGIHKGFFSNTPYWLVKNSWGSWWGEKGYYLVYRGDGTCGLNQMVSSATIK